MRRGFAGVQNAFASCAGALQGCKMLSHRAPGFAGVQNAFASCAGTLQGCKMLSQSGKRLYKGAKCFPGLGNDFTRV